jgi:ribonuclease P protein component
VAGLGFGFGRDRRIRKRAEFLHVQAVGERATTPHFVLLVAASTKPDRPPSRLGIVVTKKVGNAVARARIKRLCRECFRTFPDFVPDGIDLVVIAKDGAKKLAEELGLAGVRDEWTRAHAVVRKRCASVLTSAKRAGKPAIADASSTRSR